MSDSEIEIDPNMYPRQQNPITYNVIDATEVIWEANKSGNATDILLRYNLYLRSLLDEYEIDYDEMSEYFS
jgi:hypothetical protein